MGRLGVSRAFGDKSLKPLVVADPDVLTVTLEDGDDFVVLACDGLWDVAGIDTVAELVHTHSKDKGLEGVRLLGPRGLCFVRARGQASLERRGPDARRRRGEGGEGVPAREGHVA